MTEKEKVGYLLKHEKFKEMLMDFFVFLYATNRGNLEFLAQYKEYKKQRSKNK